MKRQSIVPFLIASFVVLLFSSWSRGEDKAPADPRAEIATLIPHAIKLLEEKKLIEFLKLNDPDSVKKMEQAPGGLEKATEELEPEIVAEFILMLKEMKKQKPRMSADGTSARFKGGFFW